MWHVWNMVSTGELSNPRWRKETAFKKRIKFYLFEKAWLCDHGTNAGGVMGVLYPQASSEL